VNVRPATRGDLSALVDVHARAFDGQLGPLLGSRYLHAFLGWFIDQPGAVSLVAEHAGALQGYVFGALDGYGHHLGPSVRLPVVLGLLRQLPRVVRHPSFGRKLATRLRALLPGRASPSPIFTATPRGCFCLVGIGAAPEARGRGVGRALVEAFCAAVPKRRVILDVYRDNAPARALYERCGFRVLAEDGRVLRMIRDTAVC